MIPVKLPPEISSVPSFPAPPFNPKSLPFSVFSKLPLVILSFPLSASVKRPPFVTTHPSAAFWTNVPPFTSASFQFMSTAEPLTSFVKLPPFIVSFARSSFFIVFIPPYTYPSSIVRLTDPSV